MIIEKSTMERFVNMLQQHEIIVVGRRIKTNYDFKFIGMHNGLKWDFTPMVAYVTSCRTNGSNSPTTMTVRSYSADELVCRTLEGMRNHCVYPPRELAKNVSDYLAYFWM